MFSENNSKSPTKLLGTRKYIFSLPTRYFGKTTSIQPFFFSLSLSHIFGSFWVPSQEDAPTHSWHKKCSNFEKMLKFPENIPKSIRKRFGTAKHLLNYPQVIFLKSFSLDIRYSHLNFWPHLSENSKLQAENLPKVFWRSFPTYFLATFSKLRPK